MTSITRNLPWFIRDLGVSIVGEKCYVSLIENLDINDVDCIKHSISKGLGLGIVVGGSIVKVPQLLLIIKASSAQGLSLTSYILETLSYAITLAYSYRNNYPFSTYGENLFLTFQDIVITFLIIHYSRSPSKAQAFVTTAALLGGTAFALNSVPLTSADSLSPSLQLLQLSTLPLSLFSKLPQIIQNYRSKSTGQLSFFAVFAQIAGCAARLFTVMHEVGDVTVAAGFVLALVLNLVLGAQVLMYLGQGEAVPKKTAVKVEEKPVSVQTTATSTSFQPAPIQQRVATPPPGNRKWARKVD